MMGYEEQIVKYMIELKCTLRDCLVQNMETEGIDTTSVFSMTDFLEEKFQQNMTKVEYFMNVLTGAEPDCILQRPLA